MTPVNRGGFVLLAVLWAVVILGTVGGAIMGVARTGAALSANRIILRRADWAGEACLEILLAEWSVSMAPNRLDTIDLGRGIRCTVHLENPGARINLNLADAAHLRTLLADDSLVAALLDWRDRDDDPRSGGGERAWYLARARRPPRNGPLMDRKELGQIKGFSPESVRTIEPYVTVDGSGRIDLLSAPPEVLRTVPQLADEAIDRLLGLRGTIRAPRSIEELASLLSASGKAQLRSEYSEFASRVTFGPEMLVGWIEGWTDGSPIKAMTKVWLVPTEDRLAVVRRAAL